MEPGPQAGDVLDASGSIQQVLTSSWEQHNYSGVRSPLPDTPAAQAEGLVLGQLGKANRGHTALTVALETSMPSGVLV